MKNDNYIVIQGWMRNELGLKGNELLTYALIYGFCQDEKDEFTGSISYISGWLGTSKQTVHTILKTLVEKNLLQKNELYSNGIKFCKYKTLPVVKKFDQGVVKKFDGGSEKTLPNNIDNNTISNNIVLRGNNGKCICQNCKMEVSDLQNGIVESDKPIPYTITDTETYTENIYSQIVKAYNEICISLPKCIKLTDKRKKKMEARLKDNSYDDIITAFTKAEQSDFLSGRNGKWQACNFEWFFEKPDTILNVLEGKYDQKKAYNSVELKFEKALDNIRSGENGNGSYFD